MDRGEEAEVPFGGIFQEKMLSSPSVSSLGPDMANEASMVTTNLLSVQACISQASQQSLLVNFNCSKFLWILFPHLVTKQILCSPSKACLPSIVSQAAVNILCWLFKFVPWEIKLGSSTKYWTSKWHGRTGHGGVEWLFPQSICAMCMWIMIDSSVIWVCSNNVLPAVSYWKCLHRHVACISWILALSHLQERRAAILQPTTKHKSFCLMLWSLNI